MEIKDVTSQTRRNLLLISKVLQNASNQVEFGEKEDYMAPLNKFVLEQAPKFQEFLLSLSPNDSEFEKFKSKEEETFNETFQKPKDEAFMKSVKFIEDIGVKYYEKFPKDSNFIITLKKLPNRIRALSEMGRGFEETFSKIELIRNQLEQLSLRQQKLIQYSKSLNDDFDQIPHLVEISKIFEKIPQYSQRAKETSKKMKTTTEKVDKIKKRTEKLQVSYKKKLEKK